MPSIGQTQLEARDLESWGDATHLGQSPGTEQVEEDIDPNEQMEHICDLALRDSVVLNMIIKKDSKSVWMWQLDHKESWALKNWCFWTMELEKALESPLDCKEIQPANPKGYQS